MGTRLSKKSGLDLGSMVSRLAAPGGRKTLYADENGTRVKGSPSAPKRLRRKLGSKFAGGAPVAKRHATGAVAFERAIYEQYGATGVALARQMQGARARERATDGDLHNFKELIVNRTEMGKWDDITSNAQINGSFKAQFGSLTIHVDDELEAKTHAAFLLNRVETKGIDGRVVEDCVLAGALAQMFEIGAIRRRVPLSPLKQKN
jgi:hypothetical protein